MKVSGCWFFSLVIAMWAGEIAAQPYPIKPVRFLVPFAPGGGADLIARVVGLKLQEKWGQQVIVDNRSGAGGNIAAELTAAAAPDGYTIFQLNVANAIAVSLFKKLNYDPVRDFSAVSLLASAPFILLAQPALKVGSVQELIALAKAQPGKLTYASSGNAGSSHLAAELLKTMTNINLSHVPYKGGGPAATALLAGEVHLLFGSLAATLPQLKAGRVRALGVTSPKRTPLAPEVPTIAESGVPGYEASTWFGLVTPAVAPRRIVDKLYADVKQVLDLPEVHERLSGAGVEPIGSTPEQFAQFIKTEVARWSRVVKFSGAQID